ncbi:carbohydrate porin [Escherichia fergusonii]|uniref:carbohydrate porin n=1 Tax=Escherichia fergusonii TaxID=564 RepID=UPI000CF3237A|nr:carbohydrate porin [Escherichia fergusonii]EHG5996275.1 carbohydrate porin [Escherichia fergusonii]MBA8226472.1 carbohydrate porin [Escherichia fergusonii]MCP9679157.1 carbohydrate porin [Escherichia fergusonii]MCP9697573.1 carbohydrate porin [Escherichia fergusonii]PQI95840.1 lactam utilization protein LamB [Escherichia fergusonii]
MKKIKTLPVTLAVIAALYSISAQAQEFTQEQIDAIVAKAVDKALAERQEKMDAAAAKKVDVINEPESAAQSPDMAIPFGVKFSGYARYGAHFQSGDQKYVAVDGSYNGASAIGRLGNEGNGGEFQLSKAFKSDNGAIWDVNVMIDHWGDEVNLKKAYAGVTNVLASNPDAYIWAGRDFHQRPQQGINDYFWMTHDGQGAGVKNFDIGGIKFDLATVAAVESCNPEVMEDETNPSRITCTGGSGTGDRGNYAVTSKIHGMKLGPLDLELYANYGFDSKAVEGEDKLKAWQGAFVVSHSNDSGVNKVIARYSDNSDNSVYNKTDDLTTIYASFEGSHKFTQQAQIEYLLAFHDYDNSSIKSDNRKNYGVIVRPMYFWNDVHSTWLEAGYQRVDYDKGGDNSGWKLTLSQNISIAMGPEFRPMLRFYMTGGQVDNDRAARVNGTKEETLDDFNLGAMWEAWF